MNETCDRCGPAVPAARRVARDGELYLCGHCASQLLPALSAQGWTVRAAGEHLLAPQTRRDGPGSATFCREGTAPIGVRTGDHRTAGRQAGCYR